MKKTILLFLFVIFISLTLVSAVTFTSVVSNCTAEDAAVKGTFAGACDDTTGASLQLDDTSLETHIYTKTTGANYGGVRIQSVNTSITTCNAIIQVFVCYKWWRTDTATPQDCDISVDANGGASYTAINTSCPGASEPGLISCQNVTANETWTCGNFFGTSGTRAYAKSELTRVTAGGATTETGTWDVMYFNVTYTTGNAPVINNIDNCVDYVTSYNQKKESINDLFL